MAVCTRVHHWDGNLQTFLLTELQCQLVIPVLTPPLTPACGTGKLQANPHVAGPRLSHGKPTKREVTTMGSDDLAVGEDHLLGPSCQQYNWQTGM